MSFKSNDLYQFLFKVAVEMQGVLEHSPWNINNCLLVLVVGRVDRSPPLHAFDWVELWVAKNLLQKLEIPLVHIHDTNLNGFKIFRIRMSVNLAKPLRKYMFLQFESTIERFGFLRYERVSTVCFHCSTVGHSKTCLSYPLCYPPTR